MTILNHCAIFSLENRGLSRRMLNRDQLLKGLLNLLDDAEGIDIDDAVAHVKNHLAAEAENIRKKNLEKIFHKQIATLKERETPINIIELLSGKKDEVLEVAVKMHTGRDNIPFLPVIPQSYRGLYDVMEMLRYGERKHGTSIIAPRLRDLRKVPRDLYYIYDVEGSDATCGQKIQDAVKTLRKQSRLPLTIFETLALCVHTNALYKHSLCAAGSRYVHHIGGHNKSIPYVYCNIDRAWGVGLVANFTSYPHLGTPSCGRRA